MKEKFLCIFWKYFQALFKDRQLKQASYALDNVCCSIKRILDFISTFWARTGKKSLISSCQWHMSMLKFNLIREHICIKILSNAMWHSWIASMLQKFVVPRFCQTPFDIADMHLCSQNLWNLWRKLKEYSIIFDLCLHLGVN